MNCQQFCDQIVDLFYGEASATLESEAVTHRAGCAECAASWTEFEHISTSFQSLGEHLPSSIITDKILEQAEERCARKRRPSILFRWQSVAAAAVVILSVLIGYGQKSAVAPLNLTVASLTPAPMEDVTSAIKDHIFRTSMDQGGYEGDYQLNRVLSGNAQISNASQSMDGFDVDDDFQNIMPGKNLDQHELESLYYRARKLEKLGQFREAYNDYELISKFYPSYDNVRFVLLGMARCLQNLDQKDDAVAMLKNYKSKYGSSSDIDVWLDRMRSETF
jgi:hypothetical protein